MLPIASLYLVLNAAQVAMMSSLMDIKAANPAVRPTQAALPVSTILIPCMLIVWYVTWDKGTKYLECIAATQMRSPTLMGMEGAQVAP